MVAEDSAAVVIGALVVGLIALPDKFVSRLTSRVTYRHDLSIRLPFPRRFPDSGSN